MQVCSSGCWSRLQSKWIFIFFKTKIRCPLVHICLYAHYLWEHGPRRRDVARNVHIFRICTMCAYFGGVCIFLEKCAYFGLSYVWASQSHRKVVTHQRTCKQIWILLNPIPFDDVPHFFCSPVCHTQALVHGSAAMRKPRICTFHHNMHISSKYAQNMHILENMHISRKVASARPPCSQMERKKKNVNQWASNFCFEKHNYLLGLQPAPTTASRELQKNLYVLCILCAYFVHIHWRICTFVHILART